MSLLSGCATQATTSAPTLHLQAVDAVRVISPHLSYARTDALVPKDHYWGLLAGAVTTCGTEGVNLTPSEMARRPVTVTLWHQEKLISSVRLDQRSGFAFLVVGGTVVRFPYNPKTHEQPFGWSPGFTVRASNGFAQPAGLGGVGGAGEVVFQIPARPHLHPCYPNKPSIPDVNRESLGIVQCNKLSIGMGPRVSPATGEHAVMITLANVGASPCDVIGYPKVTLLTSSGHVIPFAYLHGHSQYTFNRPPRLVTLAVGATAYVEVTKYRCDLRAITSAATLRLVVPVTGQVLSIRQPTPQGVGTLSYCQGRSHGPGNLVSVSPVSVSARSLYPQ
jgi:hypothetical protein